MKKNQLPKKQSKCFNLKFTESIRVSGGKKKRPSERSYFEVQAVIEVVKIQEL